MKIRHIVINSVEKLKNKIKREKKIECREQIKSIYESLLY